MIARIRYVLAQWLLIFRGPVLASAIVYACTSCTDEGRTHRILVDEGYTQIRITGYAFAACGRDDEFSTGFEAMSAAGRHVSGAVCCGLLKGCTVRHR